MTDFAALRAKIVAQVDEEAVVEIKRGTTPLKCFVGGIIKTVATHHVIFIEALDKDGEKAFFSFERSVYGIQVQYSRSKANVELLTDYVLRLKAQSAE